MKHDPTQQRQRPRRRLRNLYRRGWRLHHRPAHRPRSAQDGRRSATTKCWNWPASAPASCTRAASSSPRNSTCRCRCARRSATSEGTWIVPEADWMRDVVVCGAALVRDEARVVARRRAGPAGHQPSHLRGDGRPQHRRGHDRPERRQQRPGRRLASPCPADELPAALDVLRPLAAELGATLDFDEEVSKVSIVGTGMRTHTGVAERMFAALAGGERQLEDDYDRRHQDFGFGGQSRRRARLCGRCIRRSTLPSRGRARACRRVRRSAYQLRPAGAEGKERAAIWPR